MTGFAVLSYGIAAFHGVVAKLVLDSYRPSYSDNKFKHSIFPASSSVFVCNFVLTRFPTQFQPLSLLSFWSMVNSLHFCFFSEDKLLRTTRSSLILRDCFR